MTEKSTGQMQKLPGDSSASGAAASTGETPGVVAVTTLTMSRGTRPFITGRAASGVHNYRRRSA
ncbi:hypothetical protein GCM10028822_11530 [Hymenobacter terrigena]